MAQWRARDVYVTARRCRRVGMSAAGCRRPSCSFVHGLPETFRHTSCFVKRQLLRGKDYFLRLVQFASILQKYNWVSKVLTLLFAYYRTHISACWIYVVYEIEVELQERLVTNISARQYTHVDKVIREREPQAMPAGHVCIYLKNKNSLSYKKNNVDTAFM